MNCFIVDVGHCFSEEYEARLPKKHTPMTINKTISMRVLKDPMRTRQARVSVNCPPE